MVNHPNRRRKIAPEVAHDHDRDYSALLNAVAATFTAATANGSTLFLTDAEGLYALYIQGLPLDQRQVHTCHACRRFIEQFGSLATIDEAGRLSSAIWSPAYAPAVYQTAFGAMAEVVGRSRVEAPFLSKFATWGTPLSKGGWTHISVTPRSVYCEGALTAAQAMAAMKERYRTVVTALGDLSAPLLDQAIRILTADALDRSERFVAPVKWLRALHDRPKGRTGENILWRQIATAPEGYCHPKASVIGPLLEDIAAGLPFETIKAKFDAKLHPLLYQRPQAAPSEGNIKAAEALFAKLGLAPALERRFARLDEVAPHAIWLPKPAAPEAPREGVFSHLKPKGSTVPAVEIPAQVSTWAKFASTILPSAERLEIMVPSHGNFTAMLTAVHADAPQILKWGNPVSGYVYHNGSSASEWGLSPGWTEVTAIVPRPNLWGENPQPALGIGAEVIIKGAMDSRDNSGNAIFPECLKADLHGVRSTIEAYSRNAKIAGRAEGSACGYAVSKGSADCTLRAFVGGAWSTYRIDRWD